MTLIDEAWETTRQKVRELDSEVDIISLAQVGEAWGMNGEDFQTLVQAAHISYLMALETGVEAPLNSTLAMMFLAGLEYGRKHG